MNNINSDVSLESVYAKNAQIETESGNVNMKVDGGIGYSVDFKSKKGKLNSYIDNGKNQYICGDGAYSYIVKTKKGNFTIDVITEQVKDLP